MNLETEYRLTPEIVKRGVHCFWKFRYIGKRELILISIFLIVLVSMLFAEPPSTWSDFIILGLYLLFFFWYWIVRFRIYFHLLNAQMTQFAETRGNSTKFELGEKSAIFTAGPVRWESPWEQLRRVMETDDVVLLLWGGFNFTIMPRDELADDLLSLIRQKVVKRPVLGNRCESGSLK